MPPLLPSNRTLGSIVLLEKYFESGVNVVVKDLDECTSTKKIPYLLSRISYSILIAISDSLAPSYLPNKDLTISPPSLSYIIFRPIYISKLLALLTPSTIRIRITSKIYLEARLRYLKIYYIPYLDISSVFIRSLSIFSFLTSLRPAVSLTI